MDKTPPFISVIMSVYNAEDTLEAATRSILDQTYPHFEFIIIDDGSTDSSPSILKALQSSDNRIQVITQENKGLTCSLNIAIKEARGALIARQDADDLSLPSRFEKQVARFDLDSGLLLLGTNAIDILPDQSRQEWRFYGDPSIKMRAFLCAPFPHASVMMNARALHDLGGYNEDWKTSQDMELWMRFAKKGRISMIAEPLIHRKVHEASISSRKKIQQFRDGLRARLDHSPASKLYILYFSLRSLIIAFLPHSVIQKLKKTVKRS